MGQLVRSTRHLNYREPELRISLEWVADLIMCEYEPGTPAVQSPRAFSRKPL
jgi:hypothetical protein